MTRYISQGITLIEMMIVIVILSILLAIAVPNFSNLILSNQISGHASDFIDTLRIAKTESNAKLTPVTVCVRNNNGDDCDAAATWSNGWIAFLDNNGDTTVDNGETIIYEYEALGQQITVNTEDRNGNPVTVRQISYTPNGGTDLNVATRFIFGNQDGTINRRIHVTVAGHASPCSTGGC